MAQSWHTKRSAAQADYADRLAYYQSLSADQQVNRKQPVWKEWQTPTLKAVCIQANTNVLLRMTDEYAALALEEAQKGCCNFWLRLSTLDKGNPVYLPVILADYHREALGTLTPNSSMRLNKWKGNWWLTLIVDVPQPTVQDVARGTTGVDIGIRQSLSCSWTWSYSIGYQ